MTNLERLALLGNKEAQKECTEKGILLPCPICNGVPTRHKISEDFLGVGYKTNGFCVFCLNCRTSTEYLKSQNEADERWNTRRTPPIGRCEECQYQEDCRKQIAFDKRDYILEQNVSEFFKLGYCSYFEPRCEE